ncbi:MAG: STAS domain-containing protein [Solirubrobacteraceae bacterium]
MSCSPIPERGQARAIAEPDVNGFACDAVSWGAGASWIRAEGELDLAARGQFDRTLAAAQSDTHLVVVDLRGVAFMDSAGLHSILDGHVRARRQDARLLLVPGSGQTRRLLALTGADRRLEILDLDPGDEPASGRGR